MNRHSLTFMNLDDTPGDIYRRYKVPYQPAWVFVAQDGTESLRLGSMSESELTEILSTL